MTWKADERVHSSEQRCQSHTRPKAWSCPLTSTRLPAHVYHTLSRSKEKQTLQIWKKQKEQKLKRLKCEIIFQHHTYWAFKMYPVHQQHQPPERRSPGFKPTEEIDAQEGEPSGLCFTNNPNILWPRICGLSHSKTKADITQMLPWIENPRACIFPYSRFSPFVMPLPLF